MNSELDLLKEKLLAAPFEEQFDILVELAVLIWKTSSEELITYAFQALEVADNLKDNKKRGKALHLIGVGYYSENRLYKSLEYFNQSIELRKESQDHLGTASSLNNIGLIYWKLSEYDKALINYQESLLYMELVTEQDEQFLEQFASTLTNIGNLYDTIGKYEEALREYHKALNIHEKIENDSGISILLNNIGNVHRNQKSLKEALSYYHRSLEIKEKLQHKAGIGNTLHNIGQIYFMESNDLKTLDYCNKSLKIFEEINDKFGIAANLNYIGKVYTRQGNYEDALEVLKKGEDFAKDVDAKGLLKENYYSISDLYTIMEQYKNALTYYKEYSQIKEELFNEEKSDKIAKLQTRYEIEKKSKEAEIYRLKNVELVKVNRRLKQMYVQLDLVSKTDPLTKVYNRRAITEKLEDERVRFERNGRPFVVILGDIDNFKQFNDKYGHDCGDFVLIEIASLIQNTLRKQDSVGRWGGEEFFILLPETDLLGGEFVAEKIRSLIEDKEVIYRNLTLSITITFGVAYYQAGESIDQLIKNADNALYKGKKEGRNCVKLSQ